MQRTFLLAKIHGCTLTAANIDYMGSISIDQVLLDAAGIFPYEQVQVVNIANGERFITYAISAPAYSGAIELNGAAARLGVKGDRIIVMTYAQINVTDDLKPHCPTLVFVDAHNTPTEVHHQTLAKATLTETCQTLNHPH